MTPSYPVNLSRIVEDPTYGSCILKLMPADFRESVPNMQELIRAIANKLTDAYDSSTPNGHAGNPAEGDIFPVCRAPRVAMHLTAGMFPNMGEISESYTGFGPQRLFGVNRDLSAFLEFTVFVTGRQWAGDDLVNAPAGDYAAPFATVFGHVLCKQKLNSYAGTFGDVVQFRIPNCKDPTSRLAFNPTNTPYSL